MYGKNQSYRGAEMLINAGMAERCCESAAVKFVIIRILFEVLQLRAMERGCADKVLCGGV